MTLTQEKDEYCDFNVVLRAENLPDELKPKCFAEYDPGYVTPDVHPAAACGKSGFESISVKLYYYILEAALEQFGEAGWDAMCTAMEKMAVDAAARARNTAEKYDRPFDEQLIFDTYPLTMDRSKTKLWDNYTGHEAVERFMHSFVPAMQRELEKK